MTPLSSADPGGDEDPTGKTPPPPAEEITDPALRAEVDNPAQSNAPTGSEASPASGRSAADDAPQPAAGAPDELSSDQTPAQGGEEGTTIPDESLADVAGGDAGAPESGPSPTSADVVPAQPVGSAPGEGGATVPEQPASPTGALAGESALAGPAEAERVAEATAAGTVDVEEPEVGAVDEARQQLVDRLEAALDGRLLGSHIVPGVDATVRVGVDDWHRTFEVCRDDLGLTYFDFISAIDWLPSPYGRSEDVGADNGDQADGGEERTPVDVASSAELEHGTTGGETRFQLLARLVSPTTHLGLTLKADVDDDEPRAPTVSDVYAGADWHERETWEMYGIDFSSHANLVHLYLPGAFEGHPLRKDFPLLAREVKPWPGLVDVEAMPGEDEAAAS